MLKFLLIACIVPQIFAFYSKNPNIVELNPYNFDEQVKSSDKTWVVEFYAPWCPYCQEFADEYEKAASSLKGIAKVGAVDVEEYHDLSKKYSVQILPTVLIFSKDKNNPEVSRSRSHEKLVNDVLQVVDGIKKSERGGNFREGASNGEKGDVVALTDGNFDRIVLNSEEAWLVKFYAPWCGHCQKLAPHWAKAAKELKGKVKLGALDATINTQKSNEYKISGYPLIKYYPAGKKSAHLVEDYNGGRTTENIVSWALEKIKKDVPPPEVYEITNNNIFRACLKRTLCIITILPNLIDCNPRCRNDYLKIMKDISKSYKSYEWSWMWSEGGKQKELEGYFDIGGFGYPALVIINSKKMKFAVFKGSFSKKGLEEFFKDVSYGKLRTSSISSGLFPNVIEVEKWNGKNAKEEL